MRDDDGFPIPCASGVQRSDDGETACVWAVFDNVAIAEDLAEHHDDADRLAQALTGWRASYGGPGRWFRDHPWARIGKYHTLVRQRAGLDI